MLTIGQRVSKVFSGMTGSNILTVGGYDINILVSGVAAGDVVVNEDGSGDALLFENGDTWVTE